jgi:hypothetical protein
MADPTPPVDPTPEDTEGVVTPQEAHLRDGNLIYHCGLCKNYEGAANMTCTKVSGTINPYQLSDEYEGYPNPMKHKTPVQFRPRTKMGVGNGAEPAADAGEPAEAYADAEPDMPPARIGRQVYN